MFGIDVSQHNGVIEWDKLDIDFAMIRAGYGDNTIDKQFARNTNQCETFGIPYGVYWFSYALTVEEAVKEAKNCVELIKSKTVEFPVVYDFEYDSVRYAEQMGRKMNKEIATDIVEAFCEEIERAGYYAMVYANKDYMANWFDMKRLAKFDLWFAYWDSVKDNTPCGIWQYSSTEKIEGVKGNVDVNKCYKNYPRIIREMGLNRLANETFEDVKKERDYYKEKYTKLETYLKKLIADFESAK